MDDKFTNREKLLLIIRKLSKIRQNNNLGTALIDLNHEPQLPTIAVKQHERDLRWCKGENGKTNKDKFGNQNFKRYSIDRSRNIQTCSKIIHQNNNGYRINILYREGKEHHLSFLIK